MWLSETVAVGALTVACPPAGIIVGGVLLAKKIYSMADHAQHASSDKTQAGRTHHLKLMIIDAIADECD